MRRMLAVVLALVVTGCASSGSGAQAPANGTAQPGASSSGPVLGGSDLSGSITVLAAASLTETFTTIARRFESQHPGVTVVLSFGGSSTLATQIAQGAPADVFAAASKATMARVLDDHLAGDAQTFARNSLEIAVPRDNPAKISQVGDLARAGVKVALCAAAVPCGAAARMMLANAKVALTPVSEERDVKAVLTKVRLGEVDAGLVYVTDVRAAGDAVVGIPVPQAVDVTTDYPIAVLRDAKNPVVAQAFLAEVRSAASAAVLTDAGFALP